MSRLRIILLLAVVLASSNAAAAPWRIEHVDTGEIIATFEHIPGGTVVIPGFPDLFYHNVLVFFDDTLSDIRDILWCCNSYPFTQVPYFDPAIINDDSHISTLSFDSPVIAGFVTFMVDFASPLTNAGGTVALDYLAWGGNGGGWCRDTGSSLCTELNASDFLAHSVPIPGPMWLIGMVLVGMTLSQRRAQASWLYARFILRGVR